MGNIISKLRLMIERFWYSPNLLAKVILYPISAVIFLFAYLRKRIILSANEGELSCLSIVIGNITVGGTGKTPLVLYLSQLLKDQGYKVAVVLRGYKGRLSSDIPAVVSDEHTPLDVGDEACIYRHYGLPVVIGKNRLKAAEYALSKYQPDIIISDDGLQHYLLPRDIELCVIDGNRKLGNGLALPLGPLREHPYRLNSVDFVLSKDVRLDKSYLFTLNLDKLYLIEDSGSELLLPTIISTKVHAVAGIGNPDQFFDSLRSLGLSIIKHQYPDHHIYTSKDFEFNDNYPIIMTEKDAVKCKGLTKAETYVYKPKLAVDSSFISKFLQQVTEKLDAR